MTNNVGLTFSVNNRVLGFDKIYSLKLLNLNPSFPQMYSFVVVCIVRSTCGDTCVCSHTMVWEKLKALEFQDQTQLKLKLHLQNLWQSINKIWLKIHSPMMSLWLSEVCWFLNRIHRSFQLCLLLNVEKLLKYADVVQSHVPMCL